jgi:N-acetylglucosamine kinase-like BadF-type ATPase
MPRQLDTRLVREEGRRTVGTAEQRSATIRQRRIWRAETSIGAVIRSALADAGVDVAQATRLCLADEAAAAVVTLSDTPEAQDADLRPLGAPGVGLLRRASAPRNDKTTAGCHCER